MGQASVPLNGGVGMFDFKVAVSVDDLRFISFFEGYMGTGECVQVSRCR